MASTNNRSSNSKGSLAALTNIALHHPSEEYLIPSESIPGNGVFSVRYYGELVAYFRHIKTNTQMKTDHTVLRSPGTTDQTLVDHCSCNHPCTHNNSSPTLVTSYDSQSSSHVSYQTQVRVWSLAMNLPALAFSYHWGIDKNYSQVPPWLSYPSLQSCDLAISNKLLAFVSLENKLVYSRLHGSPKLPGKLLVSNTNCCSQLNGTTPTFEHYGRTQDASTFEQTVEYPCIYSSRLNQLDSRNMYGNVDGSKEFHTSHASHNYFASFPLLETLELEPLLRHYNITHSVSVKVICWQNVICLIIQEYGFKNSQPGTCCSSKNQLKHTTFVCLIKVVDNSEFIELGGTKLNNNANNGCHSNLDNSLPIIFFHSLIEKPLPIHRFSSEGILRQVAANNWIVVFEYMDCGKRVHLNVFSIATNQDEAHFNNFEKHDAFRYDHGKVNVVPIPSFSPFYFCSIRTVNYTNVEESYSRNNHFFNLWSKKTRKYWSNRLGFEDMKQATTTLTLNFKPMKPLSTTKASLRDLARSFAEPLRCVVASDTSTISAVAARLNSPWALPIALIHILLFAALAPLLLLSTESKNLEIKYSEYTKDEENNEDLDLEDVLLSDLRPSQTKNSKSDTFKGITGSTWFAWSSKQTRNSGEPADNKTCKKSSQNADNFSSSKPKSFHSPAVFTPGSEFFDYSPSVTVETIGLESKNKKKYDNEESSCDINSEATLYSIYSQNARPNFLVKIWTSALNSAAASFSFMKQDFSRKYSTFSWKRHRTDEQTDSCKENEDGEKYLTIHLPQIIDVSVNSQFQVKIVRTQTWPCSFLFKWEFWSRKPRFSLCPKNKKDVGGNANSNKTKTSSWFKSEFKENNIRLFESSDASMEVIKAGKQYFGIAKDDLACANKEEKLDYKFENPGRQPSTFGFEPHHSYNQDTNQKCDNVLQSSEHHDYFESTFLSRSTQVVKIFKFSPTAFSRDAYLRAQKIRGFSLLCSFVCLGLLVGSVLALYRLVPAARLDLLAQLALADAASVFLLAWCQDIVSIGIRAKWKWWVWRNK